jgi:hypothetical protein
VFPTHWNNFEKPLTEPLSFAISESAASSRGSPTVPSP